RMQAICKDFGAAFDHYPCRSRCSHRCRMEDEMLKVAAVCAALIAFATGPLGAYEREANIQRIAGSDDTSDMIVAIPKSANAPIYELGGQPNSRNIHLAA